MKKLIINLVLILALAFPVCAADVYETGVTVTLDGTELDFSGVHEPVIKNDYTLVPMRRVFEAMGADVVWNDSDQSITAEKDGVNINLSIGSDIMTVADGAEKSVALNVAPELLPYDDYADTTMIPLRAVSESFGYNVEWVESSRTVLITSPVKSEPTSVPVSDFDASAISENGRLSWYDNQLAYIKDDGTVWYAGGGQVPGLSGAVQIALGKTGGYALTADGRVYSWGSSNDYGQLGVEAQSAAVAQKIDGLENIKKIDAGAYFGIALSENGKVYTWGRNDKGQLGNGLTDDSRIIVNANVSNTIDIAAGSGFAAAVGSDGRIYTWGENSEGQLGRGAVKYSATPGKIPDIINIKSVSAGTTGAAAIRSDGSVYAWGTVYLGVLGDGEEIMYHDQNEDMPIITDEDGYYRYDRPRRMPYCEYSIDDNELQGRILLNVTAVSCGEYQYAAISEGKAYMWGDSPVISSRRHSQYEHYYAMEYSSISQVKAICAGGEKTMYALLGNGDILKVTYGRTEKIASVK